jgi:predicted DNA-binding transcriptional regulator AlpA
MDDFKNALILFPIEPDRFLHMIRDLVREELEKFASSQIGANHKVPGLTFKPLYKMDEVCELFEVTPPTIYDWIKHGKLKPKKVRSRVYFLWNDIQDLLQEKRS